MKIFDYLRISSVGMSTVSEEVHSHRGYCRSAAAADRGWQGSCGNSGPSQGGTQPSVPTPRSWLVCRKRSSNLQARMEQEMVTQEVHRP